MAPVVKVPVPAGSLKVAFKGDVPKVSMVHDDSPMYGIFKIGYSFQALELGDGTIMQELDTYELVAALNEYSTDPNRYMRMEMTLPAETIVVLTPGAHGLIIEEKWGKAILTRIQADSPLKKELRVGMVVDAVTLPDGYKISGHTAMEINDALNSAADSADRTLILKSPSSTLSPRSGVLPSGKRVSIPTGTVDELGLKITGTSIAKIDYVMAGSPLEGDARGGYAIEALVHPEGHVFTGLPSAQLKNCLNRTAGVEGRSIVLTSPRDARERIVGATTKIMLPANGGLEEFGLQLYGNPAIVGAVSGRSILQGMVFRGYQVQRIGWNDGTEFRDLDAMELAEVMNDSSGVAGRYLYFSGTATGSANVVDVPLPTGKLGITLKGTPPILTKMSAASPLNGLVNIGMAADTLTLEGGTVHYGMNTVELTTLLKNNMNQPGREIRFVQFEEVGLTPQASAQLTEEMNVILPMGPLGLTFKGYPAVITSVKSTSALAGRVAQGMAVDYVTVNRRDYMDMNAVDLANLIKSTTDVPGRMMKLRLPSQTDEFSRIPDELEVVLPPGKLGVTFTGRPAVAKSFRDDSPIAASIPPGMFIDKFVMPDGYSQAGMSTRELVGLLNQFINEEGRCIVLRNAKTSQPSNPQVLYPMEKTVTISTGKLGLSFKGRNIARISRVHDDSKMKGICYKNMLVDSITIPGGSTFSGMTAKEAARILIDTKNVGGRTMTLKSPENSDISVRNISTDDASIGGSSQNMSDAFSTYSGATGATSGMSVRM